MKSWLQVDPIDHTDHGATYMTLRKSPSTASQRPLNPYTQSLATHNIPPILTTCMMTTTTMTTTKMAPRGTLYGFWYVNHITQQSSRNYTAHSGSTDLPIHPRPHPCPPSLPLHPPNSSPPRPHPLPSPLLHLPMALSDLLPPSSLPTTPPPTRPHLLPPRNQHSPQPHHQQDPHPRGRQRALSNLCDGYSRCGVGRSRVLGLYGYFGESGWEGGEG